MRHTPGVDVKPSVLHVVSSTQRRGAETFAYHLSQELGQLGHRSEVVALVSTSTDEPLDLAVLGQHRRHPRTLLELRRLARNVDVVVAHGGSTLEACAVGLVGTGTPFVYRVISDPRYWLNSSVKRWVLTRLHRRAILHVVLAEMIIPYMIEQIGIGHDRIAIIPNGVRASDFPRATADQRSRARSTLGVAVGEPVAAFIGALSPEKNVVAALDLVARRPDLLLLIAGDGPDAALVRDAQRGPHGQRIRYLGSRSDTWPIYAAADVVVIPSHTEMMPAVAIEAAMVGTPVLATRVGTLEEMKRAGVPAELVESLEPGQLLAGLSRILDTAPTGGTRSVTCTSEYAIENLARAWSAALVVASGADAERDR